MKCGVEILDCKGKATFDLDAETLVLFGPANEKIQTLKVSEREKAILRHWQEKRVTKEAALNTAWPSSIVRENNVWVVLSKLKKLFRQVDDGCRCLVVISGRGYVLYPARSVFYYVAAT